MLFFDRSGPTKTTLFYEVTPPEGRKNYTKTQPMQFEEFADCIAWWKKRKENGRAWKVSADDVLKYNGGDQLVSANLDLKNPNAAEDVEHVPPEKLVEDILEKERRIIEIMGELRDLLKERL